MQKFRICAGGVKVLSAKLLMGISWSSGLRVCPAYPCKAAGTQSRFPVRVYAANMASTPKSQWKTLQRFAENLVFNEAPKLVRHVQNTQTVLREARKVVYAPDLDGRADPGEIVWTWVVYEDDPSRGKDRPVLVVGRDRSVLLGLMVSSQEHHAADRDWIGIGSGNWDYEGRQSWVRLDRVLDVPEESIRREGAILERKVFDVVAARLRNDYSWR